MAGNDQYLIPGLFPFSRLCGNPVFIEAHNYLLCINGLHKNLETSNRYIHIMSKCHDLCPQGEGQLGKEAETNSDIR